MKLSDVSVNLSKDGWHRKLQLFTFGHDVPLFQNLCPFFWLTIAAMFLGPLKWAALAFFNVSKGIALGGFAAGQAILTYVVLAPMVAVGVVMGKVIDKMLSILFYQGKKGYRSFSQKPWSPQGMVRVRKRNKFADFVVQASDQAMMKVFDTLGKGMEKIWLTLEDDSPRFRQDRIYDLTPTQWQRLEDKFFETLDDWFSGDKKDTKEYKDIVRSWEVISAWRVVHPDWEERQTALNNFRKSWLQAEEDKERARQAALVEYNRLAQIRKEKFIKVAEYTKIAATLGAVLMGVGAVGAILFKLGTWLFNGGFTIVLDVATQIVSWAVHPGLMYLGMVAAGVVAFGVVIATVVKIAEFLKVSWNTKLSLKPLAKPFVWMAGPFGIFFAYAMAVKKNQCPGIDWE